MPVGPTRQNSPLRESEGRGRSLVSNCLLFWAQCNSFYFWARYLWHSICHTKIHLKENVFSLREPAEVRDFAGFFMENLTILWLIIKLRNWTSPCGKASWLWCQCCGHCKWCWRPGFTEDRLPRNGSSHGGFGWLGWNTGSSGANWCCGCSH